VLRPKGYDQVEVYDIITYRLQRCLTVPNAKGFIDMTSCEHCHCVYISDHRIECIHRLDVHIQGAGAATQWAVKDEPCALSVNAAHNLLVVCRFAGKIKEFSSHGDLLRELALPDHIVNPLHAIQLATGQFVVCHGGVHDNVHRVCMISADDGQIGQIVHSHGGRRGSDTDHYHYPIHLAVDKNEFVYVVDPVDQRVTLLSPTLQYVRPVVSSDNPKWRPGRLCLDVQRQLLYVAENEVEDDNAKSGRAVVYSV